MWAYLRVLVLSKVAVSALQLLRDLVPLLLSTVLDRGLDDTARVMFEDDILNLSAQDVHKRVHVLRAVRFREVFLAREGPSVFCFHENGRMRFGGFSLLKEDSLCFMRLARSFMGCWKRTEKTINLDTHHLDS